jgi:hypothetical protein
VCRAADRSLELHLSAIYPQFDFSSMERIGWTHALSVAATLALAAGAICILLFAM